MRIGIDLRPLEAETKYRGIGMALQFLLEAMAEIETEDSFVFYVEQATPLPEIVKASPGSTCIKVKPMPLGKKRYIRSVLPSYRAAQAAPKEVDVFLQYYAMLCVPTRVPTARVFYDLIPMLFNYKDGQLKATSMRAFKNSLATNAYWRKYTCRQ
jgi:hypothetical protein